MAESAGAQEIRRLLERGLGLYQQGAFSAALAEWERALALAPSDGELRALVEFGRREQVRAASGTPTTPLGKKPGTAGAYDLSAFSDDWDPGQTTNTELAHETLERVRRAEKEAVEAEQARQRMPTLSSPVPAILARLTDPTWKAPEQEIPATGSGPQETITEDKTDRLNVSAVVAEVEALWGDITDLGPDDEAGKVIVPTEETPIFAFEDVIPEGDDAPTPNPIAMWEELASIARTALGEGRLEDALVMAERALMMAESAEAQKTLSSEARAALERTFETYLGDLGARPAAAAWDAPTLGGAEVVLLERVDGTRTFAEILAGAELPRLEALRAMARLRQTGAIRVG